MMNTNDRRKARRRNQLLAAVMAVAVGLTWGQAGAWAGAPRTPTETQPASGGQSERSTAPGGQQPLVPSAEDGYAAREAQAKNLENFKGGDVVIITTTTVLIILVVVLILILI